MNYRNFIKIAITPMREITEEEIKLGVENLKKQGISISKEDIENNGSPKKGDMIAMNPENPNDKWLVEREYFKKNYKEVM